MKTILTHHDVGPQFLELLQSFATGGKEAEAGPGSLVTRTYPDGSRGLFLHVRRITPALILD
jgi:hypothetical protein